MMMRWIREAARHIFNPLHVYCRLVDCGVDRKRARGFCKKYEVLIYNKLAGPR